MPKPKSQFHLDFSSLLGPLFFVWVLQILLPINVHNLVSEKENKLRLMMKLQGLSDLPYYIVTYVYLYLLYCCFLIVFMTFGTLIQLSFFTQNPLWLQMPFYWIWGHLLVAWSLYFASWFSSARLAVYLAVVCVIGSGLIANFLLNQFIVQGPEMIAEILQIIPSFGLYRILWEMSQYAFLRTWNGGNNGLTWKVIWDHDNDFGHILISFLIQWFLFLLMAWYNDQVSFIFLIFNSNYKMCSFLLGI